MTRRVAKDAAAAQPSDTEEIRQLLAEPWFDVMVAELAGRLHRDTADVKAEAAGNLREMAATHSKRAAAAWRRFGDVFIRAYEVVVDEEHVRALCEMDSENSLVLLPSHRSYLDSFVATGAFHANGIRPPFAFGGANLNFFPFGTIAKHTGLIFIRRKMTDAPVYRLALRGYIGHLVRHAENLSWAIEGGRTRTGKLRPPAHGILSYVIDAVQQVDGPEIYLVPMSIVYDQLHEVSLMASEARGGRKKPEGIAWMLRLARQQKQRLGRAYVDIGELIPLRRRVAELQGELHGERRGEAAAEGNVVERIALEICHGINRATPLTPTAVATLALLGADRALTLDEVLGTVRPLADYVSRRQWRVAGSADLRDLDTIRRTLDELVASGVLITYDGGIEPVWAIAPGQHLVAAFYRNTIAHVLVERAIAEVALRADDGSDDQAVIDAALRVRELLKFEFFFSPRDRFVEEIRTEIELLRGGDATRDGTETTGARGLEQADVLVAHLVLRPFLDAYAVVADRLVDRGDRPVERDDVLNESLALGRQWELQHRLASAESVSLELFGSALRLAAHRQLLDGSPTELGQARRLFAAEIDGLLAETAFIGRLAGHPGIAPA
ncbi:MAG: lysophospholipid acyltransferase [Ilumatobacteraceae bacterium]|nr:MAG: lysophospholipid acyltransferase [Actinomycetota bacterium]